MALIKKCFEALEQAVHDSLTDGMCEGVWEISSGWIKLNKLVNKHSIDFLIDLHEKNLKALNSYQISPDTPGDLVEGIKKVQDEKVNEATERIAGLKKVKEQAAKGVEFLPYLKSKEEWEALLHQSVLVYSETRV